jgi:hypothetical protein
MRKILLNRKVPSSSEIKRRQDFELILKKYKEYKDYWRSPWFYGIVGLASFLSISVLCLGII